MIENLKLLLNEIKLNGTKKEMVFSLECAIEILEKLRN